MTTTITTMKENNSNKNNIAGLYDLQETLGKGHFAVVKSAVHAFTKERVAVKIIDKSKLDPQSQKSLLKEVLCMKLVQHPHVVRLYEVIDTSTKLFLVLELGRGDLYDLISSHGNAGLEESVARHYFKQIFDAVSYCHKLHVVHRDLKPENVVYFPPKKVAPTNSSAAAAARVGVSNNVSAGAAGCSSSKNQQKQLFGVVKLTDFGFSNKFSPGEKLDTSCGSLAYSAPEILLGDAYDAPAVDIWSLGVILFTLVVGSCPFQEANDSETLTMIMDCKYSVPRAVSLPCKELIQRMLQRRPEERISVGGIGGHVWVNNDSGGGGDVVIEPLLMINQHKLNQEQHDVIINQIIQGGVAGDEEGVAKSLALNAYDHITSTYYLLAERLLREQQQQQSHHTHSSTNTATTTPTQSSNLTTTINKTGSLESLNTIHHHHHSGSNNPSPIKNLQQQQQTTTTSKIITSKRKAKNNKIPQVNKIEEINSDNEDEEQSATTNATAATTELTENNKKKSSKKKSIFSWLFSKRHSVSGSSSGSNNNNNNRLLKTRSLHNLMNTVNSV